jgi:hypothetical protein
MLYLLHLAIKYQKIRKIKKLNKLKIVKKLLNYIQNDENIHENKSNKIVYKNKYISY